MIDYIHMPIDFKCFSFPRLFIPSSAIYYDSLVMHRSIEFS